MGIFRRILDLVFPSTYVVVKGDSLWRIARQYPGVAWQDIYAANRDVIGSNPNKIYPGQVLYIPKRK
jgi:nucleoid-associated protein YgaU